MDPLQTLADWIEEARAKGAAEPDAMALGTATRDGIPSVRIVLCRGVDARGVRFFTNYESRKGLELADNPRAAATFFWPELARQARVEGAVARCSADESDDYFAHRPRGHQLSAWASAQSRPIAGLPWLRAQAGDVVRRYEGKDVPRPPYWGGYRLEPRAIELWKAGADRLHDRVRFERSESGWSATQLAP